MSASIIGAGAFVPQRVGPRQDALAMVFDDGGGGTPYAIDICGKLLHAGQTRTAAIVFHQPTRRGVDHFLERTGLPAEQVAIRVDRYGCTHAAGVCP